MKKIIIVIIIVAIGCFTFGSQSFAGQKSGKDGFKVFYSSLQRAFNQNDRDGMLNLMSDNFQWALDGIVTKEQAFQYMGEMNCWGDFKKALARKPKSFTGSEYSTWRKGDRSEFIFIKEEDGRWKFSEVRGD